MVTTSPKTTKIEIAKLTFDPQIYPRVDVSTQHIAELAEALRAGASLPPIIVERKGLRIIDGVHRWRACKTVHGTRSSIDVELRDYENEKVLFLDAVKLNATHGLPYSSFERTRTLLRARDFGIPEKEIAQVLHIRVEKAERLKTERVAHHSGNGGSIRSVPLKRSMEWLGAGSMLTNNQLKTNASAGGMPPLYYVNLLIGFLESGLWAKASDQLRDALKKLSALIVKEAADVKRV
jgi:hypothetical protein